MRLTDEDGGTGLSARAEEQGGASDQAWPTYGPAYDSENSDDYGHDWTVLTEAEFNDIKNGAKAQIPAALRGESPTPAGEGPVTPRDASNPKTKKGGHQ